MDRTGTVPGTAPRSVASRMGTISSPPRLTSLASTGFSTTYVLYSTTMELLRLTMPM